MCLEPLYSLFSSVYNEVYQECEDYDFYEPFYYPFSCVPSESSAEDPQAGFVVLLHVASSAGSYEVVGAVNVLYTLLLELLLILYAPRDLAYGIQMVHGYCAFAEELAAVGAYVVSAQNLRFMMREELASVVCTSVSHGV